MFIDASAIVAVLTREAGYEDIEKALSDAGQDVLYVSPLVKFEAVLALARQKAQTAGSQDKPSARMMDEAAKAIEAFIEGLDIKEVVISAEIGNAAITAAAIYGKVVGHVASLNFGDCYAYACAKTLGVRLLYKGNDFVHTDVA
ncbi:ribonuclease VapC [Rhizobium metallidurans]|uniref:Ribonuclease VapC n=1 Tax=Rhizobium metallidurans TaxID=1265931 RepID=A0A7W6GBF9_9HYPH|nr:ribonuclease VapC [Rhizobium metallidurans]